MAINESFTARKKQVILFRMDILMDVCVFVCEARTGGRNASNKFIIIYMHVAQDLKGNQENEKLVKASERPRAEENKNKRFFFPLN